MRFSLTYSGQTRTVDFDQPEPSPRPASMWRAYPYWCGVISGVALAGVVVLMLRALTA